MKPTLIDIRGNTPNEYYDRSRDIETALLWNAIKKTLTEIWREELYGYIQNIRANENTVTLMIGKPLINGEFKPYISNLESACKASVWKPYKIKLR